MSIYIKPDLECHMRNHRQGYSCNSYWGAGGFFWLFPLLIFVGLGLFSSHRIFSYWWIWLIFIPIFMGNKSSKQRNPETRNNFKSIETNTPVKAYSAEGINKNTIMHTSAEYCSNCGSQYESDAKFCAACGSLI